MPTPGVRSGAPLVELGDRTGAFALALPDDVVFSHRTAARLLGLPLPWRIDRAEEPLEVMRATRKAQVERLGCVAHRGLERRLVTRVSGVLVTSVADTWLDLLEKFSPWLSFADAVMLGDAAVELLCRTGPRIDEMGAVVFDRPELHPQAEPESAEWWSDPATHGIRDLRRRLSERGQFRGVRLARAALALVRPRVWSPMETRSRLVFVDGGVREPRLNATVRDAHGSSITVGDHVWEEEQTVAAYNGPTHELEPSRERDNSQRMRLEDEGWSLIEMYKSDINTLSGRRELLRRLMSRLDRAA